MPGSQERRLVAVPRERAAEFDEIDRWAFAYQPSDADAEAILNAVDWSRAVGVETGDGQLVGVHSSFGFELGVPGGARVPTAGLTCVGVHPQYRRQGILRTMIGAHFDNARRRGEVFSGLTASEPGIYQRFGYGLAAVALAVTVPRGATMRSDVPTAATAGLSCRFELANYDRHGALAARIHDAAGRQYGGWLYRTPERLWVDLFHDFDDNRKGAERLRILLVERSGEPCGYALFRRRLDGDRLKVEVMEAVAIDAATSRTLWGALTDLDLTESVSYGRVATDDPLLHQLVDIRAVQGRVRDGLWLRILDLPTALTARHYAAPIDAVIDVIDELIPDNAGRWRVRSSVLAPNRVDVDRTEDPADVRLSVQDLAAAYLGRVSIAALVDAGVASAEAPHRVEAIGAAFMTNRAPLLNVRF